MIENINMEEMNPELERWLEFNKDQLSQYPNHYLLIGMQRGIIAVGETREQLGLKIMDLFKDNQEYTEEELLEPTFIISTLFVDRSKWAEA